MKSIYASQSVTSVLLLLAVLILLLWLALGCHVFQLVVQLPVQVGLLIGVHGRVFLATAGVQNALPAYSHAGVRLCLVAAAVHLQEKRKITT